MVSDTLRQKFIYNTPFDDNEFPLVVLDEDISSNSADTYKINASKLYFIEEMDFENLIKSISNSKVLILNDYKFKSLNSILNKGSLCHILAFAYLFKKNGFKCNVI